MPDPFVYLVDDEPSVRDSLAMLLRSVGIESRLYPDARSFLDEFDRSAPACLIADVRMPGMSGLDLQEALRDQGAKIPMIIMTGHGDIAMAVRAMKAGASDFLEKPFNDQTLLDAVNRAFEQVRRGGATEEAGANDGLAERIGSLTPREREVMLLVAEGKPNKVVATRLGLSTRTVEVHRARVMEKMQAKSLADLVRMVIAAGLSEARPAG